MMLVALAGQGSEVVSDMLDVSLPVAVVTSAVPMSPACAAVAVIRPPASAVTRPARPPARARERCFFSTVVLSFYEDLGRSEKRHGVCLVVSPQFGLAAKS